MNVTFFKILAMLFFLLLRSKDFAFLYEKTSFYSLFFMFIHIEKNLLLYFCCFLILLSDYHRLLGLFPFILRKHKYKLPQLPPNSQY